MLRIIKSHRGSKKKEFIGVIGMHLVEILDGNPFIQKFLTEAKSHYLHIPSDRSRLLGPDERMVLKSHEKNFIVVFKSEIHAEKHVCSIKLFVYQLSQTYSAKTLLTDALRLASFRWSKIVLGDQVYPLNKSFDQPAVKVIIENFLVTRGKYLHQLSK